MGKKIISVVLCLFMIVSLVSINVFADDTTDVGYKTISGTVFLPDGETAPAGGLDVYLNADSDNGTPDYWQDDIHAFGYANIPEGQSQTTYTINVPESNTPYTLSYHPVGYCSGKYSEGGNYLIDLSNGDKTGADITIARGETISGFVSLPDGTKAPAGGVNVYVSACCNNGTSDYNDDILANTTVNIPEGQTQAQYSLQVIDLPYGYCVSCNTDGYGSATYSNQGNILVYVNNGNADGINMTLTIPKIIIGTVSLPDGDTAPAGGLNVMVEGRFDNGTPDNWQDDQWYGSNAFIPEGQSQVSYQLYIPGTVGASTCKVDFNTNGYIITYYSQQGGTGNYNSAETIDISSGHINDINATLIKGRRISGTVSLPNGTAAPAGGVNMSVSAYSDNGTPNDQLDDLSGYSQVFIPEGQNQAAYSLTVMDSTFGYTVSSFSDVYGPAVYRNQGNYLVDVSSGDKDNVDIAYTEQKTISGTIYLPAGETAPSGGACRRFECILSKRNTR